MNLVGLQKERDAARAEVELLKRKLEAVREQAIYGFTGETLENMRDGMSGVEMNRWWMKQILAILEAE